MLTRIKSSLIPIIDRGWFGLQPLNTHIAICGCPRSGTSLMLHILEACVEDAHTFGREVGAIKAATTALRNNRYMVSKLPRDIFVFDDIRALYSSRDADVKFVVMLRDPRGILTSIHPKRPGQYYVDIELWREAWEQIKAKAIGADDCLIVRFEELLRDPKAIETRFVEFTACELTMPFEDFHSAERDVVKPGIDRPLDTDVADNWQAAEHRDRIMQLIAELPELPEWLIEMGYETDTTWRDAYR